MQTLVTGGGGFLGRSIVEQLLARGDRVRSYGRGDYPELVGLGAEVLRGDLNDPARLEQACAGVDCVFHVAARPGTSVQPAPYYAVNTQGTQHVLQACRQQGVRRLVYTSSPSVVFAGVDQVGVDESIPLAFDWLRRHRCYYAHSKAQAEQAVLAANDSQLRTCALRPHLIWGPRDRHLIPRLLARSGRLRRVGDGSNLVDHIYVDNAAQAHLLAADALAAEQTPVAGKAYFLSQGEPANCWQWIDEILALAQLPGVRRSVSFRSAWQIGRFCEAVYRGLHIKREPPMTRFVAAQLATSHWFDISAAQRELGYQPLVSTAEGMQRLGDWLAAEPENAF